MKSGFRLKDAYQDSKEKNSRNDHFEREINQSLILITPDMSSRPPLEVLDQIWENIRQGCTDSVELVLKVSCPDKSQEFLYIREFSGTENQAFRFTAVITTLRLVIQHLRRQTTTTLRDIYYRDVSAFHGSQRRSNESLQLLASSLNYSIEKDFKIFPSPKGLLFGGPRIKLNFNEGANIDLSYESDYCLLPSSVSSISIDSSWIDAFVVFEKEAVFKSLSTFLRVSDSSKRIVMLTGKGNPDRASIHFTETLRKCLNEIPFIVFVDSDVYGLRILWTYILAAGGPCPKVVFAGTFLLEHQRGYLTIARKEWMLQMNFLKEISSYEKANLSATNTSLELIKRELRRGMLLGVKAELNVICDKTHDNGLNAYLWHKIASAICDKT